MKISLGPEIQSLTFYDRYNAFMIYSKKCCKDRNQEIDAKNNMHYKKILLL